MKPSPEAPATTGDDLSPTRSPNPILLTPIALLALLGFAWGVRNYGREHDRHLVVAQVRELESRIRSHEQPGLWLFVEGSDVPGQPDPVQEARHQAMLRDFERLAHLEAFEIADIDAKVPGAEMRFVRRARAGGWWTIGSSSFRRGKARRSP
jgi:hypothetical protein